MGNKKKLEERKELLTIRLPYWMIIKLKQIKNYNSYIEEILKNYVKKDEND